MTDFKKPVGKATYTYSNVGSSSIPTQRMTTPYQGGQQNSKTIDQIIEESEKKSDDPFFLEEEEYLEMMSKIIRRDFFPEKVSEDERLELDLDPKISKLTLNDFVRKYKSEDNETFKKIMDREEEKWREKYWWMFLAEKKDRINQLALENGDNQEKDTIRRILLPNPDAPLAITNVESHNSMFFIPQYQPPALIQKSNLDIKSRVEKINYLNTRFDENVIQEEQTSNVKKMVTHLNSDIEMNRLSTPFLLGMGSAEDSTSQSKKPYKYNLAELMHGKNTTNQTKQPQIINGYQILAMPSPAPSNLQFPLKINNNSIVALC